MIKAPTGPANQNKRRQFKGSAHKPENREQRQSTFSRERQHDRNKPSANNKSRQETRKEASNTKDAPKQLTYQNFFIKHASLPPIVLLRNLENGTSAEDVRTILEYIGPIVDCRSIEERDGTVSAEVTFDNRLHADTAIEQFNGSYADGRLVSVEIIKIHTIPAHSDSNETGEVAPEFPNNQEWEGPPLYSDAVTKKRYVYRQ